LNSVAFTQFWWNGNFETFFGQSKVLFSQG
jgi:hypothetical protein